MAWKSTLKNTRKQWLITILILLGNLIWWLIPSKVDYLIAQHRDVLLGRYSVDRFSAMLIVFLLIWPTLYMVWSNQAKSSGTAL
jgi:hypothetical protein